MLVVHGEVNLPGKQVVCHKENTAQPDSYVAYENSIPHIYRISSYSGV